MPSSLHVHLLPQLVAANDLAGSTVAVIDVLRATTTIVEALAAGAREVIPCLEVDEARQRAAALPAGEMLLGGERGGRKIAGFDLGNSPSEYLSDVVRGRSVVFTTTNGTRAMQHARQAEHIVLAALVNLSAVVEVLENARRVDIVCAGTDGHVTYEDTLVAGWLVEVLAGRKRSGVGAPPPWQLNDSAQLAAAAAREAGLTADQLASLPGLNDIQRSDFCDRLAQRLLASRGGENLREIGLAHDVATAAQVDRHHIVPRLHVAAWRITAV